MLVVETIAKIRRDAVCSVSVTLLHETQVVLVIGCSTSDLDT